MEEAERMRRITEIEEARREDCAERERRRRAAGEFWEAEMRRRVGVYTMAQEEIQKARDREMRCVCVCVCACVRACVRVCRAENVHACVSIVAQQYVRKHGIEKEPYTFIHIYT
jgi:hypothetical protein